MGYVDGLGRARAALSTGPDTSGPRRWVRSGLSRFSRKGEVIEAYQPDYFGGSDSVLSSVVAINYAMPSSRAVYDAFGRARYSFAEDGALNVTSYHSLSTDVCDPLDNDPSSPHAGTCTTARTDGHGRLIDQILRNRPIDNPFAGMERHRLWTFYRADGAVMTLVRAQTADENPRAPTRAEALAISSPHVHRDFIYDSVSRRIASDDPDTDDPTNPDRLSRTWRYLFNRVGDLVAVRDPRGCGQNFFYDLGGRLLGEEYVSCVEAQSSEAEQPIYEVPGDAIAMGPIGASRDVDVRYFYDDYMELDWIGGLTLPDETSGVEGRAIGVADRGQRSAVAYDDRGNAIWTARQMAVISAPIPGDETTLLPDGRPFFDENTPSSAGTLTYDESVEHTYVRTAAFDHAARPTSMTLPVDPDWDPAGLDTAPAIRGRLEYDRRGLPARALLSVGTLDEIPVVAAIEYLRDGLVSHIDYGDLGSGPAIASDTEYDVRRRPTRMTTTRAPDAGALAGELGEVSIVHDQRLQWDAASNLTALVDERDPSEWPAGFRPQTVEITHDSLYRVVGALFHYSTEDGDDEDDTASNWRTAASPSNTVDPMRPVPAAMVGEASTGDRVRSLTWEWDWLGNMTEWTDDAQQFYERSIGDITNGQPINERPSALYVASDLDIVGNGGGWVEVDYGRGGNVTYLTVHGECTAGPNPVVRAVGRPEVLALANAWVCATEQHFEYRWDELNRISEARRWDRTGGSGAWSFEARQRYRYDGANQRTVKESFDTSTGDSRIALYIYPGDFERRGVVRGGTEYESVDGSTSIATETQYLVAGARLVWDHAPSGGAGLGDLDRNRRLTMGVSDLIGTTAASVDLLSGELLEVSTYYPNGARETLRTNAGVPVPLEPMGFTGKEADEDVGLVYFGERYLIARLGRWASADPLHVHASGGGEALNSYHYVSGNLLQARDPLGLAASYSEWADAGTGADGTSLQARDVMNANGDLIGFEFRETPSELSDAEFSARVATLPAAEREAMEAHRSSTEPHRDVETIASSTTAGPGGIPAGALVGTLGGIVLGICTNPVGAAVCTGLGIVTSRGEEDLAQVAMAEGGARLVGAGAAAIVESGAPATRALVAADRELAAAEGVGARVSAGGRGDGRCVAHACASATTPSGTPVDPSRVDDIWVRLGSEPPSSPTFETLVHRVKVAIGDLGIPVEHLPTTGMADEFGDLIDGDYLILQREGAGGHLVHGRARDGVMTIFDNQAPTVSGPGHSTLVGRTVGGLYRLR